MSELSGTASRLEKIQQELAEACARAGRSESDVDLIAVSKAHSPDAVLEAADAGQILFGESRVQEARAKIPLLPSRLRWHFIGHLQSNKVRAALPLFELFHGVDNLDLARDIQRIADEEGLRPAILLEVNVAEESTKFGFKESQLEEQMEILLGLDRLSIEGLMCIPPPQPKADGSRPYFKRLRELRDQLEQKFRCRLPQLSMGMSSDFAVAIEEGATYVRVGTAIFGERSGKAWKPENTDA